MFNLFALIRPCVSHIEFAPVLTQALTPFTLYSPITFFTELATNATAKNVGIILYTGNNDFLIPRLGTESTLRFHPPYDSYTDPLSVAIQNTTFGGIQGFTKKPSTPWYDDTGKFAGIIHQERGWKYALFYGTGHLVPAVVPRAVSFE